MLSCMRRIPLKEGIGVLLSFAMMFSLISVISALGDTV